MPDDPTVPDDVPAADAAEQRQATADEPGHEVRDIEVPIDTDPADWQEQQLAVDDFDSDERR